MHACAICNYPIRWRPALNRWVHVLSDSRYCEPAAPDPFHEGIATHVSEVPPCEWFAKCDRPATHMAKHPAFPQGVPCCDRCAEIGA